MTQLRTRTAHITQRQAKEVHSSWLATAVFLCFLVSGGTSLILEGTLMRLLRFVLGNTTLAVTTVLCAYMAGLALGSYVSGRLCDRSRRLLRAYGLLEGAAAVCCLLLPAGVEALEPAYRWMYLHLQHSPLMLSLARFLLCGLLLLVPSTFMGATLPVLTRWASLRLGLGRSIAALYAINSGGAAAGALLCGFVLLPGVGVTWTLRLACTANILICILMLVLDRVLPAETGDTVAEPLKQTKTEQREASTDRTWRNSLLLAYGLSGATAMIYEVTWTRGLALVVGSSTYAFSLMLAAFILGLSIGSAIMVRFTDRVHNRVYWFAVVELGIGLSAMLALPLIGQLPITMVGIVQHYSASFAALQSVEFLLMMLVMMVPTTLMGAAFPLVCRACTSGASGVGHSIGSVYAANTVGGIVGTFLASFVLIPRLGTQNAILVGVAVNILIGLALGLPAPGIRWVYRLATGLVAAIFGIGAFHYIQPWDPSIMTSGAYIYADKLAVGSANSDAIRNRMQDASVVFHKEDMCTNVTVRRHANGARTLSVGGKVDASSRGDAATQLLCAHVPLLLHPNPRSACVIGLASGMSLGSAACYDLDRIDCVEISPAIVEASYFFSPENHNVLSDPRVRLIIGDGRNHLALTSDKYDVIVSEPSNPWIAGVADLFTQEYFELCRRRLSPGGLACIWVQAYAQDETLFRSVVRTFHETFPYVAMVESIPMVDYLLVGSTEPICMPYATLAERLQMPKIAADLQRISIHEPLDFLRRFVMSKNVEQYARGAMLHTDDNALVEFAAPRMLYRTNTAAAILQGLDAYRGVDLSYLVVDAAQQEGLQKALEPIVKAAILGGQAIIHHSNGRTQEALAAAGEAAKMDPSGPEVLNCKARATLESVTKGGADKAALQAAALAPNLAAVSQKRAASFMEAHLWAQAQDALECAVRAQPQDPASADNLAWLIATCPDTDVRNGRTALKLASLCCQVTGNREPRYLKTLAAALAETGNYAEATRAAQAALNLARQSGQAEQAKDIETQMSFYQHGKAYRMPEK